MGPISVVPSNWMKVKSESNDSEAGLPRSDINASNSLFNFSRIEFSQGFLSSVCSGRERKLSEAFIFSIKVSTGMGLTESGVCP